MLIHYFTSNNFYLKSVDLPIEPYLPGNWTTIEPPVINDKQILKFIDNQWIILSNYGYIWDTNTGNIKYVEPGYELLDNDTLLPKPDGEYIEWDYKASNWVYNESLHIENLVKQVQQLIYNHFAIITKKGTLHLGVRYECDELSANRVNNALNLAILTNEITYWIDYDNYLHPFTVDELKELAKTIGLYFKECFAKRTMLRDLVLTFNKERLQDILDNPYKIETELWI